MSSAQHADDLVPVDVELRYQLIHDFIADRGSTSLYAYLRLSPASPRAAQEAGLQLRMTWAREHQRDPKHRKEASWLLFNQLLLRSAMLDRPEEYIAEVRFLERQGHPAHPARAIDSYDDIQPVTCDEEEDDVLVPTLDVPTFSEDEPTEVEDGEEAGEAQEWATRPETEQADAGAGAVAERLKPKPDSPLTAMLPLLLATTLLGAVILFVIPMVAEHFQPAPPPSTRLTIAASPSVGSIYINDVPRGTGGSAVFEGTLPEDRPVEVRIEADGFEAWSETVMLTAGMPITLSPELVLTDPMQFRPVSTHLKGELPADFKERLGKRQRFINACFRQLSLKPGTEISATIKGYTTSSGAVGRVQIDGVDSTPEFDRCIQRQLRALQLPADPMHDYAVFSHTFTHTAK